MSVSPKTIYRVSIKAFVVEDGRILLVQEKDGRWELPGGGLVHGETAAECLQREIAEETGFTIATIADRPLYFWTQEREDGIYRSFLGFAVALATKNFVASEECVAAQDFSREELSMIPLHPNIQKLPRFFRPEDFR